MHYIIIRLLSKNKSLNFWMVVTFVFHYYTVTCNCLVFFCKETDSKPTALGTYLINPVTDFAKMLCGFMTSRPIVSQMYNFLRGFNLHSSYNENTSFITWKGLELYLYHWLFQVCILCLLYLFFRWTSYYIRAISIGWYLSLFEI